MATTQTIRRPLRPPFVTGTPTTSDQLYSQIKNLEGSFPIPTPSATILMGTFNAIGGNFNGLVSTLEELPPEDTGPGPNPRPPKIKVPPRARVNAVDVELEFHVLNRQGTFRVTANGIEESTTENTLRIRVGRAERVEWVVRSGSKTYRDTLLLERPPIIGMGAFTIPALPVAIVYEPPQDNQKRNRATYTITQARGTTTTASFSQANSTTQPVASQFDTPATMRSALNGAAVVFDQTGFTATANALQAIANGLGSVSGTAATGTSVTSENALALVSSSGLSVTPGLREGPGVGDLICFLRNVRMVWLAAGGPVRLAVLDHDALVSAAARDLPTLGPQVGLDVATIEALRALDPFVAGGAQATLPSPRFLALENFIVLSGQTLATSVSFLRIQSSQQTTTNFKSRVDDFNPGSLAFLGLGVTADQTLESTITNSSTVQQSSSTQETATVEFHAEAGELYEMEVFQDTVFGTLAFRKHAVTQQALLSGSAKSHDGKPLPGALVTVLAGGRKVTAMADARGQWAIPSATLKPGPMTVRLRRPAPGSQARQVIFKGQPIRNIELR